MMRTCAWSTGLRTDLESCSCEVAFELGILQLPGNYPTRGVNDAFIFDKILSSYLFSRKLRAFLILYYYIMVRCYLGNYNIFCRDIADSKSGYCI